MVRSLVCAVLILPLLFALARPVAAGEIEGVAFNESVSVSGTPLTLAGLSLMRYRIFIKAYLGALYLKPGEDPKRALNDIPKRLVLHYRYKIAGKDFGPAAEQILANNFSPAEIEPLKERLATLHGLYKDVVPGDRYALTYEPGVGTELALNGKRLGLIPGADFAEKYFAIWIGREPISTSFRDDLLAGLQNGS